MSIVTVNKELKVFVIPTDNGYSCLGFKNCYRDAKALAEKLNQPLPIESEIGSLEQYNQYQSLLKMAKGKDLGTWFTPGTNFNVQRILQEAIDNKTELRLFYGDKETGVDWLCELGVLGKIGRSTGTLKVPLLIEKNQNGGEAIFTDNIVKIVEFTSRKLHSDNIIEGRVVWQHLTYSLPEMTISEVEHPEFPAAVMVDGKIHGMCRSELDAEHFVLFMQGSRKTY